MNRILINVLLLSGIMLLFISTRAYPQSDVIINNVSIEAGAMMDANMEYREFNESVYLSPSIRIKKHECYAGVLIARGSYYRSQPMEFGGIAGYRFYFFREPSRMNIFAHYSLRYYHESGMRHYYYYYRIVEEKWKSENFLNTFGLGFNVFFDKKRYIGLFSEADYIMKFEKYNFYSKPLTNWNCINITMGLKVKLAGLRKKSG